MSYEDQTIYGEVSNNKITLKSNRTVQFLIYLLFSAIICYVIAPIALIVITVFRAGKVIYCLTQIRKYKSTSTRRISAQPARFGAPSSPNDTKDKDEKRYRVSKKDAERYLDPANKDDLVIPWDETHTYAFKKICIYHSRCKQTDYRNYILTEPRDNEFPTASCIFYVEYDHKGKPYIICDNKNLYYFDIDYDFKQAEKDATWYQLSENDAKTAKGTPPFYMHLKDENGKIRDAFCHGVVSGADLSVILAQDFYLVSIIDYYASAFDEKNEENMQVYTLQRDVCGIYGSTESIYSYLCRDEKICDEVKQLYNEPDLQDPLVSQIYDCNDFSSFQLDLGRGMIRYITAGTVPYGGKYYALLRAVDKVEGMPDDAGIVVRIKNTRIVFEEDEAIRNAVFEKFKQIRA